MKQIYQQGIATLMITSMLLMLALVVTLGSYKSLFYQIKRSQNEVKTRQNHWLAEGAIECAYSQFRSDNKVPSVVTDCDSGQGVMAQFIPRSYGQRIIAVANHSTVQKDILLSSETKSGAMQSSADLFFYSSASFSTPDPGKLSRHGWECVALRYRNRLYASVVDNKGVIHGKKPYESFNSQGKECSPAHKSLGASWGHLGRDFVRDENLSLFEQFFGIPAAEHNKVKNKQQITVINGHGLPKVVPNCGKVITNHIRSGKHYLWIEGGCEIKRSEYNELVNTTAMTDGVLLLVHDGLLSLMGKPSSGATTQPFKGVMFHFNTEFVANPKLWQGFEANRFLNHVPSVVEESYRIKTSYYQHGAFTFAGGQYFDTPGQAAVFYDSLDFQFNNDVIDSIQTNINTPRWRQGSWYAN
ncbi:MAG: hypothetical protein ACK5MF_12710 [Vibrio sp.]|uniref:hypothetical protein n=1 Tax=Vibrio sp. TaxID=678 RepID=UPI003A8A575D